MANKYNIELTKEEIDILIIQVGARITSLKNIQLENAKAGNVERVLEIEDGIKLITSGYSKMMEVRYK